MKSYAVFEDKPPRHGAPVARRRIGLHFATSESGGALLMPFVLKTACTRGKLDLETARQILDALGKLPIEIDTSPAPGQRQLFELAMRHKLSSYDAAYLELAKRHGLPIVTQDAQLKEAAIAAGVSVL